MVLCLQATGGLFMCRFYNPNCYVKKKKKKTQLSIRPKRTRRFTPNRISLLSLSPELFSEALNRANKKRSNLRMAHLNSREYKLSWPDVRQRFFFGNVQICSTFVCCVTITGFTDKILSSAAMLFSCPITHKNSSLKAEK